MHINPRIEPWLIALLEGVQNSNHRAEIIATEAYAAERLVKRLSDMVNAIDAGAVHITSEQIGGKSPCGDPPHPWHEEWLSYAVGALALARGETP